MEQRTKEWYVARLGKITSSQVGCLVGKGKSAPFTTTGLSYLNLVISERLLPDMYKTEGDYFRMYLSRVDNGNKATAYGTSMEEIARDCYASKLTSDRYAVLTTGFVPNPSQDGWGDSPDGLVMEDDELIGTLEIKCPYNPATTIKFITALGAATDEASLAEALKKTDADYYWQCVSHCICNKVRWCDFIIYDPMVEGECWVYRIVPPEEDVTLLSTRVDDAINYIEDQISTIYA